MIFYRSFVLIFFISQVIYNTAQNNTDSPAQNINVPVVNPNNPGVHVKDTTTENNIDPGVNVKDTTTENNIGQPVAAKNATANNNSGGKIVTSSFWMTFIVAGICLKF